MNTQCYKDLRITKYIYFHNNRNGVICYQKKFITYDMFKTFYLYKI